MADYGGQCKDNTSQSSPDAEGWLNAPCSPTYTLLQKPAAPAAAVQHIDNFGKAAKHLLSEVPTMHTSMFTNDGIIT